MLDFALTQITDYGEPRVNIKWDHKVLGRPMAVDDFPPEIERIMPIVC